jgi:ribosomal protein L11 methylase PrmA
LEWKPAGTEWGDYYEKTNYSDRAFQHKKELVQIWTKDKKPALVWDLGGNTGVFSREAAPSGAQIISFDIDPAAVEQNYRVVKTNKEKNILPLVLDMTNPSPALGWDHQERDSFAARGPVDMVLALAVIHHLAISNNVPLPQLANFFAARTKWLVIEFVPKADSQVQRLLASRKDIFPDYTREGFEKAFSAYFTVVKAELVQDSERILYLMQAR